MNFINILTRLLVKAYHAEAERHHKQAQKSAAARKSFQEEAEEYRRRAEDADLAAAECLAASAKSSEIEQSHWRKAEEVERFFTV